MGRQAEKDRENGQQAQAEVQGAEKRDEEEPLVEIPSQEHFMSVISKKRPEYGYLIYVKCGDTLYAPAGHVVGIVALGELPASGKPREPPTAPKPVLVLQVPFIFFLLFLCWRR